MKNSAGEIKLTHSLGSLFCKKGREIKPYYAYPTNFQLLQLG